MTDDPFQPPRTVEEKQLAALHAIENRLYRVEIQVQRTRRDAPGCFTIAAGVFAGMLLFSLIGVFLSILFWASIAAVLTAAAARHAQGP